MSRPFCELHLHIEGTLEPTTIFDLARLQGYRLPYEDERDLTLRYRFSDLQSFLDLYYDNMQVLRTEEHFSVMTRAYFLRAKAAGIAHVELFVDPQAHTARGVPTAIVLRGIQRAMREAEDDLGITSAIIACVLRDQPTAAAHVMLDELLASEISVVGLGLDSAEVGHPPAEFTEVFARAREAGLRVVAHAGEEGPPAYVWQALDELGAERIDHGVRAMEDLSLVRRLAEDRIPITLCPLSNVRLRVASALQQVPLRRMLDAGLLVTINSDDPAYFGGYLDDNLQSVRDAFDLTDAELDTLCDNSIEGSFLTASAQDVLRRRLREDRR